MLPEHSSKHTIFFINKPEGILYAAERYNVLQSRVGQ